MIDDGVAKMLAGFTHEGAPLSAIIGSKQEWGVTVLTAAMISNENLAAQMTAEEIVDAAINYYNVIQERLGYYQQQQAHSLERLLNN
jgi:hypothetical protein